MTVRLIQLLPWTPAYIDSAESWGMRDVNGLLVTSGFTEDESRLVCAAVNGYRSDTPTVMTTDTVIEMCKNMATGHYRRGITPEQAAADYEALKRAVVANCPSCVQMAQARDEQTRTRHGGNVATGTPFYLQPGQCAPEYDQGHAVVVWYDDLVCLADRVVKAESALSEARQQIAEIRGEMLTIAMVAGQCSVTGPRDTKALMAAAEAERAARWADRLSSLLASPSEGGT